MSKGKKLGDTGKASGSGQSIQALALREGTPVSQEAQLTKLLSQVAPADEIPPSLLQVLADVLAFLDDLESAPALPPQKK